MFIDTFDTWYTARMKRINKGGVIDVFLTQPMIREYLFEAYKQGYIDCYMVKDDRNANKA